VPHKAQHSDPSAATNLQRSDFDAQASKTANGFAVEGVLAPSLCNPCASLPHGFSGDLHGLFVGFSDAMGDCNRRSTDLDCPAKYDF
jgi:hypothetical protein